MTTAALLATSPYVLWHDKSDGGTGIGSIAAKQACLRMRALSRCSTRSAEGKH